MIRFRFVRAASVAGLVAMSSAVAAQTSEPPSASRAKVVELVDLLQAKKREAFAVRDPAAPGRYVGALLVPGAQLLVVSAKHGRPSDLEYYLYQKDYMSAYMDLNSSVLAVEKTFIEDARGDGLVAQPGKNLARDSITIDGKAQVFDGEVADPRKRNDKRMPQADYDRLFGDADAAYMRLLDLLLAELKRAAPALPGAPVMR